MSTKQIIILVAILTGLGLGVFIYVSLFVDFSGGDYETTDIYDDSYVDSVDNTDDISFQNGLYISPDLSAMIPDSWVLLDNVNNDVLVATNVDETIQFSIVKYSSETSDEIDPIETIKYVFDDSSSDNSSHANFTVLEEPKSFDFKTYLAAEGMSNSDIMISDTESINVTGRLIYAIVGSNQYQIVFEAKSEYFDQENEIFNQFLESLELE